MQGIANLLRTLKKSCVRPVCGSGQKCVGGQCVVTISPESIPEQLACFVRYSGVSYGVASRGLFDLLEKLAPGSSGMKNLARHQGCEGFGNALVLLNRHFVSPELTLHTTSDLFMCMQYNLWIDETDGGVNLKISLPVMEAMGYSTLEFLD
jgi:hypothetical protein